MEDGTAIIALSALAHENRLQVFRLLVKEGPSGLAAGEIAERIGVSPSALTFHLAHLVRAKLVQSWRKQRNVFYAVHVEGMRLMLTFLTEDCCRGHEDICGAGEEFARLLG